MFDIGFWEIVVLGMVALIVVGPEQMPELIRTVVGYFRHFRRQFQDIRADVERELDVDAFKHEHKSLHELLDNSTREIEAEFEQVTKEADSMQQDIEHWDDPDRFDTSDASLPDPDLHADTGVDTVAIDQFDENDEAELAAQNRFGTEVSTNDDIDKSVTEHENSHPPTLTKSS